MRNLSLVTVCLLLIVTVGAVESSSKNRTAQTNGHKRRVASAKTRPDLNVDLSKVAQLKIATRKTTFHKGEMIDLHLALLNSSKEAVFFDRMVDSQIEVQSLTSESVRVWPYGVAERAITPSSFSLLVPNDLETELVQLLAGCDARPIAKENTADEDGVATFNQNLFVSWGRACINLTRPGQVYLHSRNPKRLCHRLKARRYEVGRRQD